jgi:N-methylhydantoinase A
MNWIVGVDTGGTFTDFVALNRSTGEIRTAKVPSTPADPSQAVLGGLRRLETDSAVFPREVSFFAHGTTVSTNAVIQRAGATTGLLITRGTNAVYLGRMSRSLSGSERLNPNYPKPLPLVPLRRTREIAERLAFDGSIVTPLHEEEVIASVSELVETYGIDSVAVCYLFSFMNPAHERRTRELIAKHFPRLRISLSSDVIPVIREYRRLSTTVLDAFVGPILEGYLDRLGQGLRSIGIATPQVFIMQSNGGLMSIDVAKSSPVQTLLSGPAAGVISGTYLGELTGHRDIVTFDVGGTSTDIATIINGEVAETMEGSVAGQDAAVLMNEISTIGAGGGTIARVGPDGRLRLGPDSAGANPGPACYDLGGIEPTVTDADFVLGYLDPGSFLGGQFATKPELARRAIEARVARPLSMSLTEAAYSIVRIANSTMESELRLNLMARGHDPKRFTMVAMGGAGPIHGTMVARSVGIETVIIPPFPGLGSAMGLLLTDVRHRYIRSLVRLMRDFAPQEIAAIFAELEQRARAEADAEGTAWDQIELQHSLDIRYVGQGYELTLPCPGGTLGTDVLAAIRRSFDEMHNRVYGHAAAEKEVEIVNFRVSSLARLPKLRLPTRPQRESGTLEQALKGQRPAWFEEFGRYVETKVYDRAALFPGDAIAGPAIIEQADSTVIVFPGQVAMPDSHQNLVIANTHVHAERIADETASITT